MYAQNSHSEIHYECHYERSKPTKIHPSKNSNGEQNKIHESLSKKGLFQCLYKLFCFSIRFILADLKAHNKPFEMIMTKNVKTLLKGM